MFQISVIGNVPAVGLGGVMSPAVGGKTVLLDGSYKLDLLHGLMWLHMLKKNIISK